MGERLLFLIRVSTGGWRLKPGKRAGRERPSLELEPKRIAENRVSSFPHLK
jgi:hypothetical protein